MKKDTIDHGRYFDWGKTSEDYLRYRDIYPEIFYQKIVEQGLCTKGQKVLDLGTGTGVLPRHLYRFGAEFVGVDLAENQIKQARQCSAAQGMEIQYIVSSAEDVSFPDNTFDVVTACQCFMYFDKAVLIPKLWRLLKPAGRLSVLFLAWLPDESEIAKQSEALVLRYNPSWTGGNMQRYELKTPQWLMDLFEAESKHAYDIQVNFTRESWNGRMKACRGIGASLPAEFVAAFDAEHMALLREIAPEQFEIPHYATMLVLKVKK